MSRIEKAFGCLEIGAGAWTALVAFGLMSGLDIGIPAEEGGLLQPVPTNNLFSELAMLLSATAAAGDGIRRIAKR